MRLDEILKMGPKFVANNNPSQDTQDMYTAIGRAVEPWDPTGNGVSYNPGNAFRPETFKIEVFAGTENRKEIKEIMDDLWERLTDEVSSVRVEGGRWMTSMKPPHYSNPDKIKAEVYKFSREDIKRFKS